MELEENEKGRFELKLGCVPFNDLKRLEEEARKGNASWQEKSFLDFKASEKLTNSSSFISPKSKSCRCLNRQLRFQRKENKSLISNQNMQNKFRKKA